VFTRLCEEVRSRAPALPERRELVHGDLLAGNVLIDSHDRVAGVIDWGNSLAGDPAFDPAWLMFWAPWHPGIDPAHIGERALDVVGEDDIAGRLLCYQLHIAADGLQYQAFAGEIEDLYATADHAERLLRGS
jgi:hygromycin-B 4-O-kinase